MKLLVFLLTVASLTATSPALTCDIPGYDKRTARIDAAGLPVQMIQAAARIDVAMAESVEPIDVDAWLTKAWAGELAAADADERARIEKVKRQEMARFKRPSFGRVHYRIVETIKGPPAGDFTLIAYLYAEDTRFERGAQRGDFSDPEQIYLTDRLVQADQGNGWDCNTSLHAVQGRRYLIFRDAEGNLLGEVRESGRRYGGNRYRWPVHEKMLADDPWLARVRRAAAKVR